jgi:hypothetical protein
LADLFLRTTSTNAEPVAPGAAQFNRPIVNNQPYTRGPGAPSGGTGTSGTTTTNPGTTSQTAQDTWKGFLDWADDQDWYTGKELSTRERSAFRRPELPVEAPKWFPGKIGELSEADVKRIDATPPQKPTTSNLFLNLNTGKRMFQYGGAWFDESTRQQVTNPNPGMDTGRQFTIPTSWLARQSVPRTTEDVYREYASLLRRGLGVM